MVTGRPRGLDLRITVESDEEFAALEQALLRARATELAEVRRRQVRLGAGYGDDGTRESMTAEGARAQLRWTMLDRLVAALTQAGAADPAARDAGSARKVPGTEA
jgi:hypothetical protein